jgi:hypothetical protein
MQQDCAGIEHVVVPHAIEVVVPPGPASGGLTPPSLGAPLLPLLLLDEAPLLDPLDVDPELELPDVDPELPPELLAPDPASDPSVAPVSVLAELPHPNQRPTAEPAAAMTTHKRQ